MDTTVILAQPCVSRLRADVVYVDASARVGLRSGSAGKPVAYTTVRFWRTVDPPKWAVPTAFLCKKIPYSTVACGAQKWILPHTI